MGSTETMKPYWTNGRVVLWQGHVLDALAAMEAGSVHCGITSPPYWGLRSYPGSPLEWPAVSYAPMAGLPPVEIPGCDPECGHVWVTQKDVRRRQTNLGNNGTIDPKRNDLIVSSTVESGYCQLCGGWRGCLGLEPTPEMFVGHIVLVARALWRVLRDDGTFWLNFGDSYAAARSGWSHTEHTGVVPASARGEAAYGAFHKTSGARDAKRIGLKHKDLIGIPWRVAFALQADGWFLRSDIIWAKGISFCPTYSGSCMPGSQQDRPTTSHEHVFLLSKKARYFYDNEAIREPPAAYSRKGGTAPYTANGSVTHGIGSDSLHKMAAGGRTVRSVWTINPGSYAGAHFATFPPALVEPMIKAGTSQRGACPSCGASWVRVTERESSFTDPKAAQQRIDATGGVITGGTERSGLHAGPTDVTYTTTGWRPTCSCGTEHPIPQEKLDADPTLLDDFEIEPFEPVPCTVLDPFLGSGTTAEVADFLGRHSVGIELSEKYCLDHIIPRLTEPLFEWAEQEQQEPEIEQMGLL